MKRLIPIVMLSSLSLVQAQTNIPSQDPNVSTENSVFMPGPSTEDAVFSPGGIGTIPTTVYDAPQEQSTENPVWDGVITPAGPVYDVNNLPQEFVNNLKANHIKQMIKKGIIKDASEVRFVNKGRSGLAFDELTLYSITIDAHARALYEGKDPMYYVDLLNAKDKTSARIIRDAQVCRDRFEFWPNSSKCSKFPTHEIAERHYDSSLKTLEERDATIAWLNSINLDLAKQLDEANKTVAKLQAQIKKLKKGRR